MPRNGVNHKNSKSENEKRRFNISVYIFSDFKLVIAVHIEIYLSITADNTDTHIT